MQENNIGAKIRNYRQKKGMTQDALAAELHVSAQAVSKWENGQTMPDISILLPLSRVLEIGVNELLGGHRRAEFEDRFQQMKPHGEELTLIVSEDALKEFPDDETFLYRRARDLYTLGKRKKTPGNSYLFKAREAFISLGDAYPKNETYKSFLANVEFELGNRERALVLAYSLKSDLARGEAVSRYRGGDEKIKYEQNILYKNFINLFNNLMNINTRESINAAYALLDATIPESKKYFKAYPGLLKKDAHLCLSEGDIEGFANKYKMAYDAVQGYKALPQERIKYTDPLFNQLSFVPDYQVHIEGFVYWLAVSDEAGHPALLDLRKRIAEDNIIYHRIWKHEWCEYFWFFKDYVCRDGYVNFGTDYYCPPEKPSEGVVRVDYPHERWIMHYLGETERLVGDGIIHGTAAYIGNRIFAFCNCTNKKDFDHLPVSDEAPDVPDGEKVLAIVGVEVAKIFEHCIEEELVSSALELAKKNEYTLAEAYVVERKIFAEDAERFDEMLALYRKLGFEVVRSLTENGQRKYIMQKELK